MDVSVSSPAPVTESSAHRRVRHVRANDRLLARFAAAHDRIAAHHSSTVPLGFDGTLTAST
eukprot:92607-Karenia_brevis.AAC.1